MRAGPPPSEARVGFLSCFLSTLITLSRRATTFAREIDQHSTPVARTARETYDIIRVAEQEVVLNDFIAILLDLVLVNLALLDAVKVPCNDIWTRRRDDGLFDLIGTSIEPLNQPESARRLSRYPNTTTYLAGVKLTPPINAAC